ncbi:Sm-like ribonucleo protein, partial [Nadsonia fulvescens var. elongata DSM 6958]
MDSTVLPSQAFTTAAALLGSVDKKVVVALRDGRKLFGILRSFDQYANLVLQDAYEYLYVPQFGDLETAVYGKQSRGVYIIRGENVQLMGEINLDLDDD